MTYVERTLQLIAFRSLDDAQDTLDKIFDICKQYGSVTLADVIESVGRTSVYTDNKIRWYSLDRLARDSKIYLRGSKWYISLPKTFVDDRRESIKKETIPTEPRPIYINVTTADMDDPDCILCSVLTHAQKISDRDIFINVY